MSLKSVIDALRPYQKILIAFSGGLDSSVLLHRLAQWRASGQAVSLRAIHVHHGLSANADAWVAHCQRVCDALNVPLEVARVRLADTGLGVEAHARAARYDAFRAALRPDEVLVTAQHLDDQCETLLLALKRGSGPAGLSAMAADSPFASTRLLRPLLNESRASLQAWADEHRLSWIEDESNQDDAYDRNFLRLRIMPALAARWPHIATAVARSAALCGEQEQLLDELLAEQLAALVGEAGQLAIAPLQAMSPPRRSALLRRWLALHGAPMPSREQLARIWQEVALAREDAAPQLRSGDGEVRRYQQRLWWIKATVSQADVCLSWPDITRPLMLADGALLLRAGTLLRRPAADEPVSVRYRAEGNIHLVGRRGGRKLKKIWQELGVAPWLRDTTPLLFYGETLIAAPGYFVTVAGQCAAGEAGLELIRERNGQ
ncbi:tRNA lysidine(34) synthetase TilS [Pluralibacter gergoviae]|uniref:tRNA lysidine(34) synthetase TilS n=1 Tax=Pluralibacter gergoviae TaxID=61647 RepID=UPI0029069C58|nr:tRNA lysidine(34) synthetase TilS [Pluralibacter gergoviae]MDU4005587.1 tRNA lysidine(34) synthetase TilS [Pluralibacter gergoviae]